MNVDVTINIKSFFILNWNLGSNCIIILITFLCIQCIHNSDKKMCDHKEHTCGCHEKLNALKSNARYRYGKKTTIIVAIQPEGC